MRLTWNTHLPFIGLANRKRAPKPTRDERCTASSHCHREIPNPWHTSAANLASQSSLKSQLEKTTVRPVPASKAYPVPRSVRQTLEASQKVLVIAHPPPDGDCLGSALGLARALKRAGKSVQICCDFELPGQLRNIALPGEVVGSQDVKKDYDTAVVVDGGDADRMGDAWALMKHAQNVVVVDHHPQEVGPDSLKLTHTQPVVWRDPHADAAALLVTALSEQLLAGKKISKKHRQHIFAPMLMGMYTDTRKFSTTRQSDISLRVFKHHWHASLNRELRLVTEPLDYALPPPVEDALNPHHATGRVSLVKCAHNASMMSVTRKDLDKLLAVAKQSDSNTIDFDLKGTLLQRLDRNAFTKDLAILLYETHEGVSVSVRSREDDAAKRLAEHLGGGGHEHAAAALVQAPLSKVKTAIKKWLKRNWKQASRDDLKRSSI